jgi:hypothetical protein
MIEQPSSPPAPAAARIQRWPRFFVIWSCVAALLIGSHLGFYFKQPFYEGGDFAANALQIRKAKTFHELYGNYSRWGFHHPGPAFFYAYAAGEALLFDTLRVVPTPYNAHALVGVLLQSLFFAWAVSIVSKHVRQPLLAPLLLVFAALHFGLVNFNFRDSAFESIWPPYVLLCPFLLFLVSAASVAAGDVDDLVPMVLAGSILVHAHIAQPLFVVPLSLLAYSIIYLRKGRSRLFRSSPYVHAAVLGILFIFLLPIGVDAFRGPESNLHLILAHLSRHSHDHKSLLQSLVYFAALFLYFPNPETICDQLTLANAVQLLRRWPYLAMWSIVAMLLAILHQFKESDRKAFGRPFSLWLAIFSGSASVLMIVWGKLQNGEMFAFNSYFSFSLFFIPFIFLAMALSSVFKGQVRYLQPLLYLVALPLFVGASRNFDLRSDFPTIPRGTEDRVAEVQHAASADRQASRTKYLEFEHADWPWAIGVALALERFGYGYSVSPAWRFMFGPEHVANVIEELPQAAVALWKVKTPSPTSPDWIAFSPPPVDPVEGAILFSGADANAAAYVVRGWDISTGPFSWSTEKNALLYFSALPAPGNVQIALEAFSADFSGVPQRMLVRFNGTIRAEFQLKGKGRLVIDIPRAEWNQRPFATLAFDFPDATSPRSLGVSTDTRLISCGFRRMTFRSLSTDSAKTSQAPDAFRVAFATTARGFPDTSIWDNAFSNSR